MSNAILLIQNSEVPLLNDVSIPVTYSIEDLRSPDKTSSDYAYTIELPGSKELDLIFGGIFDPAATSALFNPNLKTDVLLMIGAEDIFKGSIKLNKSFWDVNTGDTKYICDFVGSKSDLFHGIGEKFLYGNDNPADDLDFSEYDHVLSKTNVENSWATSNMVNGVNTALVAGTGYRYGLIDYGHLGSGVNGGSGYDFKIQHLRPMLAAREYLYKIFTDAGKTWTSTFLDGIFFKKLFIPPISAVTKPQTQIDNSSCYVGISTGGVIFNESMGHTVGGIWVGSAGDINQIEFDDDTTGDLNDPNNIWDTTAFELTAPYDGLYNFTLNPTISISINRTGGTGTLTKYGFDYSVGFRIQKWDGIAWQAVLATAFNQGTHPVDFVPNPYVTSMPLSGQVSLDAGDLIRCIVDTRIQNAPLLDVALNPITDGTVTYAVDFDATVGNVNTFAVTVDPLILEGEDVEINNTIPLNVKQKDFVKGIFQMFNLYMQQDKTNPNNYLIEPYNTFFSGTPVDWTDKVDATEPIEVVVMGELEAKRYIRQFKEDGDYFNKTYQDNWGVVYGRQEDKVENQFLTSENKVECVFSPTPMVGQFNSVNEYMIMPHIYSYENGAIEPVTSNIRILIYNGLIDGLYTQGASSCWNLVTASGDNLKTQIPYAGSLDTFNAPTFDLNFGVPDEIYIETSPAYTWASTNLTTDYWEDFINRISNKDSRLVRMNLILEPSDIKNLDFRKPVIIMGVKYLLNEVGPYESTERKSTPVELIKFLV